MKEQIYTIPLMDAFNAGDECPFCFIERNLEQHAMDFVLGAGAYIWKMISVPKPIKQDFAVNIIKRCLNMETA